MAKAPIFKKAYWSLAIAGALYFCVLGVLSNSWVQRQAIYAHNIHTAWWHDPNKPELYGYLKNQVRPFNVNTPDGEVLHGWHVLPTAVYAKAEDGLIMEDVGLSQSYESTIAFQLLAKDPQARVVISFHGNAGTVTQGWRTDYYRALASSAPEKIHVVTVDYRGFGYSTGSPTEQGLITDGVSLVKWVMDVAHIPPERIVLQGQSLGTAVATAVAEYFSVEHDIDFKALILVAAFSDIPTLMATYAIYGVFPVLSPLRPYPFLQRLFISYIQETWFTATRLEHLARRSKHLYLHLIHAKDDWDIPWSHSDTLFYAAANATTERGMTLKQMEATKSHQGLGEYGWANNWVAGQAQGGKKTIKQEIVKYGDHNRIMTYPTVSKAIFNAFSLEASKATRDR